MPNELYPQGRVIGITLKSIKWVYKYPCEMKTLNREEIDKYLDEIREEVIQELEKNNLFCYLVKCLLSFFYHVFFFSNNE